MLLFFLVAGMDFVVILGLVTENIKVFVSLDANGRVWSVRRFVWSVFSRKIYNTIHNFTTNAPVCVGYPRYFLTDISFRFHPSIFFQGFLYFLVFDIFCMISSIRIYSVVVVINSSKICFVPFIELKIQNNLSQHSTNSEHANVAIIQWS